MTVRTTHEPTSTDRRATMEAYGKATATRETLIAYATHTGARIGVFTAVRAPSGAWTVYAIWDSEQANTHGRAQSLADALALALTRGGFEGFPRPVHQTLRRNGDTIAACARALETCDAMDVRLLGTD